MPNQSSVAAQNDPESFRGYIFALFNGEAHPPIRIRAAEWCPAALRELPESQFPKNYLRCINLALFAVRFSFSPVDLDYS
jgi:hypothetical protein